MTFKRCDACKSPANCHALQRCAENKAPEPNATPRRLSERLREWAATPDYHTTTDEPNALMIAAAEKLELAQSLLDRARERGELSEAEVASYAQSEKRDTEHASAQGNQGSGTPTGVTPAAAASFVPSAAALKMRPFISDFERSVLDCNEGSIGQADVEAAREALYEAIERELSARSSAAQSAVEPTDLSPTPRTDHEVIHATFPDADVVSAGFCRMLERELNVALRTPSSARPPAVVNDAIDIAQCAIHDTVKDPLERDRLKDVLESLRTASATTSSAAAKEYARRNPLGGPAKVFEAMAARIRAGEEYYSVLDDYDLQHKSAASAIRETRMIGWPQLRDILTKAGYDHTAVHPICYHKFSYMNFVTLLMEWVARADARSATGGKT